MEHSYSTTSSWNRGKPGRRCNELQISRELVAELSEPSESFESDAIGSTRCPVPVGSTLRGGIEAAAVGQVVDFVGDRLNAAAHETVAAVV